jgi:hypothetical protein
MAAQANILVKDDASTRVEFTLLPVSDSEGTSLWRASVAGTPFEGQVRLTLSEEALKNGDFKRKLMFEVPVMETLGASGTAAGYTAPPKVAYTETMHVTHISNRRSTSQNRSDLLSFVVGCLQGASATTATGTLTQASAGGSFLASTAPVILFFTQGIRPS